MQKKTKKTQKYNFHETKKAVLIKVHCWLGDRVYLGNLLELKMLHLSTLLD